MSRILAMPLARGSAQQPVSDVAWMHTGGSLHATVGQGPPYGARLPASASRFGFSLRPLASASRFGFSLRLLASASRFGFSLRLLASAVAGRSPRSFPGPLGSGGRRSICPQGWPQGCGQGFRQARDGLSENPDRLSRTLCAGMRRGRGRGVAFLWPTFLWPRKER